MKIILTVNFGLLLRGSSPCSFFKSLVRMSFEKSVMPEPPPGIGNESFILSAYIALLCILAKRTISTLTHTRLLTFFIGLLLWLTLFLKK